MESTMPCKACGKIYDLSQDPEILYELSSKDGSFSIFCPQCKADPPKELTLKQFLFILDHIKDRITNGLELSAVEGNAINKHTRCTWGLCSDDAEQFPDAIMHVWPYTYITEERVTLLDLPKGCHCPMDKRMGQSDERRIGCFYHCRVFEGRSFPTTKLSREDAIQLYAQAIALYSKQVGNGDEGSESRGDS